MAAARSRWWLGAQRLTPALKKYCLLHTVQLYSLYQYFTVLYCIMVVDSNSMESEQQKMGENSNKARFFCGPTVESPDTKGGGLFPTRLCAPSMTRAFASFDRSVLDLTIPLLDEVSSAPASSADSGISIITYSLPVLSASLPLEFEALSTIQARARRMFDRSFQSFSRNINNKLNSEHRLLR